MVPMQSAANVAMRAVRLVLEIGRVFVFFAVVAGLLFFNGSLWSSLLSTSIGHVGYISYIYVLSIERAETR